VTKAELIPFPGVTKRTGTTRYHFVLRTPKDLLPQLKSPWAVRCSLGTADLREANDKAKSLHAKWAARFESLRSGKPAPVNLAALRAKLLAHAEEVLLPAADRRSAGFSPTEREERAGAIAWQREDVRQGIESGYVPDWAQSWLDSLPYDRSHAGDGEALAFLAMLLDLYHESLTDLTRAFPLRVKRLGERRALAAIDAPLVEAPAAVPTSKAAAKGYRIADALDAWTKAVPRPAKTVGAFTRHANAFASMMGDPVLPSITKVDAIRFRDKLQEWAVGNGKTARTADNVLVSVRALVNAARDRGWIEGNPFERLAVEVGGKKSEGREPWTHDELQTLFDDPIWSEGRLPKVPKAGADAAYWVPLIACYTGARVTEIAQLWTDDLTVTKGAEVIEFRASDTRGQRLKNDGSWRAVPMHPELVRLGLPEYVASLPVGLLFPKLPTAGKNGAGGQFSHWFGSFKRGKGFESRQKTLHSFRHLVASELRLNGATDAQADAITGHAGVGVGRKDYSATIRRNAERLRPVINLLRFQSLERLPKLVNRQAADA
jgi:integrase